MPVCCRGRRPVYAGHLLYTGRMTADPFQVDFLLIGDFSMISFASAVAPFPIAGKLLDAERFAYRCVSIDGKAGRGKQWIDLPRRICLVCQEGPSLGRRRMRHKSRFSENHIIAILTEQERGRNGAARRRRSAAGMGSALARSANGRPDMAAWAFWAFPRSVGFKVPEQENARLKRLLADQMPGNSILKDLSGNG